MWTCPKCGRTFSSENQAHYCGDKPASVDEYILAQAPEHREVLVKVRDVLRRTLPDCQETISWSMPTYRREHNVIHFAAQKKHLGIYPGPDAIEAFSDRLAGFKTTKGAIQMPYDKVAYDLITEIARWAEQHELSG